MSNLRNRLGALEEKSEFERFRKQQFFFEGRSEEELDFYATHSRMPDEKLEPGKREFTVNGWKTTVILERT